jgi:Xaa-Pro aminopeptidase
MGRQKLSFLLVTHLPNIFYLAGFRGSAGVALLGSEQALLWVDPRYTLQAKEQASGFEVIEHRGELLKAAGRWIGKKRTGNIGYDDSHLTCRAFEVLAYELGRATRLKPAGGLIETLRAIKGEDEVALIRRAGRLTAEVFDEIFPLVRPGVRESDLAAEIEYRMKRKGAEGAAFETIVASGLRSAFPHARPSSKQLEMGELVIVDLGAILAGYAADMTRTLYLGKPPARARRLYNAVREAQREAVESLKAGVCAGQVDRAARRALARRGLAKYFTHSTGHGVGLEIHEGPRLGKNQRLWWCSAGRHCPGSCGDAGDPYAGNEGPVVY